MSFLGVMLCHELDRAKAVYPLAVEWKYDGIRVAHTEAEGYTRRGNTYETWRPFSRILHEVAAPVWGPSVHVDTEMLARNWNDTSKLLKREKDIDHAAIEREVTAVVFDLYTPESVGVDPYLERREAARWVVDKANARSGAAIGGLKFALSHMTIVYNEADLDYVFAEALLNGVEGIVAKELYSPYLLKRARTWRKLKPWKDITVTVVGAEHGYGKCTSCMTVEHRERRAALLNEYAESLGVPERVERDDIKPDPECPTCLGAASGIERPDVLGALLTVMEGGEQLRVGMGFDDEMKARAFSYWIGKKIDVKVQLEAVPTADGKANEIKARHPVFMRERPDL